MFATVPGLQVRIGLPGNGRTLLEFTTPGDVDPLTPLSSVVSGIAVPNVEEESSVSDDDTLITAGGQPPTLALYTCDMTHPIPMDIPVG
ncbi:hypothetical protein KIPB_011209, partial [Kipferlia bialata]|eukprot:g11209.t1